jgi:ribonuclease P protein component
MKLNKSWQFRKVYDEGAKLVGDYVVIFYYSNPEEDSGPRFGVVASKRLGGAVERNRAKRLLREAARHYAGKLNQNHRNIWVVLVARSGMIGRSSKEVVADVGRALDSAGLIAGST